MKFFYKITFFITALFTFFSVSSKSGQRKQKIKQVNRILENVKKANNARADKSKRKLVRNKYFR